MAQTRRQSRDRIKHHRDFFSRFAKTTAAAMGHGWAFGIAMAVIVIWAVTGPLFHFSDTWQLIINTGTTIITFLMVFLIQNTQNRDNVAVQLKLNEIIRSTTGAHNALFDLEELTQEELDRFRELYAKLARKAREDVAAGLKDTGTPDVSKGSPARLEAES